MSDFEKTGRSATENLPVFCRFGYYAYHKGFSGHYHDAVEIIAVLTGEMRCTAGDRIITLKRGELALFNPYTIHAGYMTAENTSHLVLTFVLSDVLNFKNSAAESCADLLENGRCAFDEYYPADREDSAVLFGHVRQIYERLKIRSPVSETAVCSELYALLSVLFSGHYHAVSGKSRQKLNKQFMRGFSDYLRENYKKPIRTEDAAHALFLSPSRFSFLVKQHFGCSFTQYLRQYRIDRAIQLFPESEKTLKGIAEAVGFTDYPYFSHTFKGYTGITPAAYFKIQKPAPNGGYENGE
jgi:AraC-like DNA-binding protein